jgi:DNA mismatch repair protein MutS
VVEYLIEQEELRENLQNCIRQIGDLERLISKLACKKPTRARFASLKKL